MMQIVMEVLPRAHLGKDGFEDILMFMKHLVKAICTERITGLQIEELAK